MIRCLSALIPVLLLIARCGVVGPVAGGTGSDVEARVQGTALDETGAPVSGALVHLRPRSYFPSSDTPFAGNRDTVTGGDGTFRFKGVDPGAYWIEVNDRNERAKLFSCSVGISDSLVLIPADTLRPMSLITGSAMASSPQGRVGIGIPGLHRDVSPDSLGLFRLLVPEGTYSVVFFDRAGPHRFTIEGINARSAGTTSIGGLDISLVCGDYRCDSLAVRRILDANGLKTTAVGSVTRRDAESGRIVELVLEGVNISSIPWSIGRLSELRKLRIAGCPALTVVPEEIGLCKNLRSVSLFNSRVRSLPASLFHLPNLRTLALSTNPIDSLPAGIITLSELRSLSMARCRLTRLPAHIGALSMLEELDLESNFLSWVPPQIADLKNLRVLRLGMNTIDSLPEEITVLQRLDFFSIHGNELCAVTAGMDSWLDKQNPGWRMTQRCGPEW